MGLDSPKRRARAILVAGARPNFMKVAPLLRAFQRVEDWTAGWIHTGQHAGETMAGQFLRELRMPEPVAVLDPGLPDLGQTERIRAGLRPLLAAEGPDVVVVVGDVNSTLAGALAARDGGHFLVHVEAGLRSFDQSMPEERNRVAVDQMAQLLLASEPEGVQNLLAEGIPPSRVVLAGNVMIDNLREHLPVARSSSILNRYGLSPGRFGLVTLHRGANVDDSERFAPIWKALVRISGDLPLLFPVHPRSADRVGAAGPADRIRTIPPLGYGEMLAVMEASAVVLTDSGGVQEETTALGVPCLTLRKNTERPLTVLEGTNRLAGVTEESIAEAWAAHCRQPLGGRCPALWDGRAAGRCVEAILRAVR